MRWLLLITVGCSGDPFYNATREETKDSSAEVTYLPDVNNTPPSDVSETSVLDNHALDALATIEDSSDSSQGMVDASDGDTPDAVLGCESLPCYSPACDTCCMPKVDICNITCACL